MKNKHLLTFVPVFLVTTAFSQNQIPLNTNEFVIGKNLVDNSDIIGQEYIFTNHIYKTNFDTITNLLTVQLRDIKGNRYQNKGKIVQVNTNCDTILWSREIKYRNTKIQHFNGILVQTKGDVRQAIDPYTGNPKYDLKNDIYFVNPNLNIGVGYKSYSAASQSNTLEGINLLNGATLWTRDINREYGWNDFFYINKDSVIIVSAGLHSVNIKNGGGWFYNAVTGEDDYRGTVAKNAAGVALGLLTGTFVISTGYNVISDLTSNVLIDSNYIYFASKEEIIKIDKTNAGIHWQTKFESFTGQSVLWIDSSNVYMINKGSALKNFSQQVSYKKPFYAAFNKKTGQQIYKVTFDEKDNPVLGFKLKDDYAYLLFKNKIAKYIIATGENKIKPYIAQQFGDLSFFIGNQVFVKCGDDSVTNLIASDTTKNFIFTKSGTVLSIDNDLNICDTISNDSLLVSSVNGSTLSFFNSQDKTSIINPDGYKCAELYANLNKYNSYLIKNTLYYINDNKLYVINLDNASK